MTESQHSDHPIDPEKKELPQEAARVSALDEIPLINEPSSQQASPSKVTPFHPAHPGWKQVLMPEENKENVSPRQVIYRKERELFPVLIMAMLLSTLISLIPVLMSLGSADTTDQAEQTSLVISGETWRNYHADKPGAWLIPRWNGRVEISRPPMVTWLNMLSWWDLNPDSVRPERMIWRSRLVSVFMVWLILASVFWAGKSLGDIRVAILASLITGTLAGISFQAQLASEETHLVGWVTLAIAAGIWAMRPIKPLNWSTRIILGWSIAGLAMGAGVLTKGPIALLLALIPLMLTAVVSPNRRFSNLIGMIFSTMLGILIAAPWFMYVLETIPGALYVWGQTWFTSSESLMRPWNYMIFILLGAMPWTFWFISGLFQPFIRAGGARRKQLLMAWLWFLVLVVLLVPLGISDFRDVLPLMPVIGLLAAQVWSEHARLSDEGVRDPGVNLLRVPHWGMILLLSLALPAFVLFQDQWLDWNWIKVKLVVGWHPLMVLGISVGMLLVAMAGAILHFRWRPTHAAMATAIWCILAYVLIWPGLSESTLRDSQAKASVLRMEHYVNQTDRVAWLYIPDLDTQPRETMLWSFISTRGEGGRSQLQMARHLEPREDFLFYSSRVVGAVTLEGLINPSSRPRFLLVREPEMIELQQEIWGDLSLYGYEVVEVVDDGYDPSWAKFGKMVLFKLK